jgi:hypothetical protein
VPSPEPLVIPWRGRQVRIRHDDPQLTTYSPHGARLRAAVELASDVEGLRLVLASTIADRYRVRVAPDGSVIGLWRRQESARSGHRVMAIGSIEARRPQLREGCRGRVFVTTMGGAVGLPWPYGDTTVADVPMVDEPLHGVCPRIDLPCRAA